MYIIVLYHLSSQQSDGVEENDSIPLVPLIPLMPSHPIEVRVNVFSCCVTTVFWASRFIVCKKLCVKPFILYGKYFFYKGKWKLFILYAAGPG